MDGQTRTLACLLLVSGCSFSTEIAAAIDAPSEGIDAPDARPLTPYWVTAGMSRGPNPLVRIFPFDGKQFTTPCTEQASSTTTSFALRDLHNHSSLPLVYGVDAGFRSLSLTCSAMTFTGMAFVGGVRPIQQIVSDPASGIGFFTADGPNAIGVYRFTTSANGDPTVSGSTDAPSNAGALAVDVPSRQMFVAGPAIVGGYTLTATNIDLPATYVSAAMCNEPVRLAISGAYLLAFCADQAQIRRYTRSPFATDATMPTVGALGAVDIVAPLPGDRIVAARKAPMSDLVVVSGNAGLPAWGAGPPVPSRVLAIGASPDGRLLATARVTGPSTSELAVWQIDDNTITLLDVLPLDSVVTALAVSTPGT